VYQGYAVSASVATRAIQCRSYTWLPRWSKESVA
jgi:hypothetical protein